MVLIKLSARNLKSNLKNYLLYFVSMTFVLMIFFMFSTVQFNTDFAGALYSGSFKDLFKIGSFAIALFAGLFIWYSNNFFTRKRSKEVALYSLLGIHKSQISFMFLVENCIMGLLALLTALFFGSLLSKLLVMTLLKIMGHYVQIGFQLPLEAFTSTWTVFLIIITLVSVNNVRLINNMKLAELFGADQRGEKLPNVSWLAALIALFLLGVGYVMAYQTRDVLFSTQSSIGTYGLLLMAFIISGTFLLFRNFLVAILSLAKKKRNYYLKGMNLISVSTLFYRIKGNALMLGIICLLSATTLGAFGFGYSNYYTHVKKVEENNAFSYVARIEDVDEKEELIETIDRTLDMNKAIINETQDYTLLQTEARWGQPVHLMSIKDFNRLRDSMDLEAVTLQSNKVILVYPDWLEIDPGMGDSYQLIDDSSYDIQLVDKTNYFSSREPVLVVGEDTYNTLGYKEYAYHLVQTDNPLDEKEAYERIIRHADTTGYTLNSMYGDYAKGLESNGFLLFLSGFMGIVFLIATGSIIYFKQTSEADKDRHHYQMLYKMGVSQKSIKLSIYKQLGFIFACPVIIAMVHNAFAQLSIAKVMGSQFIIPTLLTTLVFLVIYGIYYLLTVRTYYKQVMR